MPPPELALQDQSFGATRFRPTAKRTSGSGEGAASEHVDAFRLAKEAVGASLEESILLEHFERLARETVRSAAAYGRHRDWIPRLLGAFLERPAPSVDIADLKQRILESLSEDAVELGTTHAAEPLLERALRLQSPHFVDLLQDLMADSDEDDRAGLIRCLGRLPAAEQASRQFVMDTLGSDSLAERDAAVRALEAWGSRAALGALSSHEDGDALLADYVARVVRAQR